VDKGEYEPQILGVRFKLNSQFMPSFSQKKKGIQEHIPYFCGENSNALLCANLGGKYLP
jgi:hypothetical protein